MDSKYCQYLYKNLKKRTVVGIRGMDEYTMKNTYQIIENVWLDWEFKPGTPCIARRCSTSELHVSRPINIHGSRLNYHIPPLTKFLPFKKPVSYTHLRAHETSLHLVCRLLLEKIKIRELLIRPTYNNGHI